MDFLFSRFNLLFVDLLLPMLIGYVLKQKKVLTPHQISTLIKINIRCIVSIISLFSFWSLHLTMALGMLPILGILACVIPGIIARYTGYYRYHTYADKGAYMMASMLANIGTLAGLGAFIAYGLQGFAYVQLMALFQNMFTMLFCFPLANYFSCKGRSDEVHQRIRILDLLFNWNQISVIFMGIGFLLAAFSVPVPSWGKTIFTALVHVGAWAGLIPVGFMISFGGAKKYFAKTWDVSLIKFIVLPILAYIPFNYFFKGNSVLLGSMLLSYASPTAINAVLASNLYKLNENITVAAFIVTTSIFLLIIFPFFYFWGQFIM